MKHPIISSLGLAVLVGISLVAPASAAIITTADSFGSGANAFTMNFVTIGNPNVVNDDTGYGAVANTFRMSTYEVSVDMINKANAAGVLGITKYDLIGDNRPATLVSWNAAARFVNWLNVSSGSVAAYKFSTQPGEGGYDANADIVLWASGEAGYNDANPFRNSNAKYFLPSENEWYKAAYYSGTGSTYYNYATGSDAAPMGVASGTVSGTAVYGGGVINLPADANLAGGLSPYGTMGQDGNVGEWMETNFSGTNDLPGSERGYRGGAYSDFLGYLGSSARGWSAVPGADGSDFQVGFRVASSELAAVPEPTMLLSTLALVSSGLLLRRRGKTSL